MNRNHLLKIVKEPVIYVFLLAFGIRLFACLNTYIVNPDGIHYIHQARALFYNEWHSLTSCHIKYISPLPFLIAAAFSVFRDWVIAGRFISLLFSFATLFPLYFLLRRFFDKTLAHLTLLVYALIPVFVSRSADIVRDPIFWFLICSGMLLFVRSFDARATRKYPINLLFACFLFLLSAWTRIEGVMFILASCAYLLFRKTDQRPQKLFFFSLPIILVLLVVLVGSQLMHHSHETIYRTDKIRNDLSHFVSQYKEVRDQLKALSKEHKDVFGDFLRRVHNVVWMVPFAMIFSTIVEGFFYPYALLFFLGFIGINSRRSRDGHLGYFILLVALSFGVLYVHLLQTWLIYNRFLAMLIFPSFLFIGFGIENTLRFFKTKCGLRPLTATVFIVVFILAFGLGKNIRANHEDKIVYRQAGEIIASQKEAAQIAKIAGVHSTVYEWVFFYAHRNYPGPICAKDMLAKVPNRYEILVKNMRTNGARYLFFEENQWSQKGVELTSAPYQEDFTILGRWYHKDTGNLMLLELKNR